MRLGTGSWLLTLTLVMPAPALLSAESLASQTLPPLDSELKKGIAEVENEDLEHATFSLARAVQRLSAAKGRESELATAHLYLAAVHLGLGQPQTAAMDVLAAWRSDKDLQLDPVKLPPGVIAMYEQVRKSDGKTVQALSNALINEKEGVGHTVPIVLLGGAAAAVAIAASTSGSSSTTSLPLVLLTADNARFDPSRFACPDGPRGVVSVPGELVWSIVVDLNNTASNRDVTVQACSLTPFIVSSDTPFEVGSQIFMPCTINGTTVLTLGAGTTTTVHLQGSQAFECVNAEVPHSNSWTAAMLLSLLGRDPAIAVTTNTLEIVRPAGR